MLARCLLAAALLAAILPATASAASKRLRGETAQSRAVSVVVNESGRVQRLVIAWRADDCRPRRSNVTVRRASTDAFTVTGSYRVRGARIRFSARGTRSIEQWSGTFRARSTVRRHGRVIDRCQLRTTWSAGLPPAPLPSPPPAEPPPPEPAPEPAGWSMHFTSDPGDYIGQGRSWSFAGSTDEIHVPATRDQVGFRTGGWVGEFAAPPGQVLEAGRTYDGARRWPFNDDAPGLSITGDFRGCDEISGTFTVNRVEFAGPGELRRFEVTFEQHCEHQPPALRGSWTYHAP